MTNEMTAEEAIEFGKMWLDIQSDDKESETYRFFHKAIQVLEAQPCEDCISRAYIKPIIEELEYDQRDNDYVLSLLSDIKNAPSVNPQRPKGKWMECGGVEPWLKGYCCSLCNFTTTQKYDYCTCGAEMSGGGQDED